ncbi:hypothetical protein ACFLRZ_03435 [Bacteroidota bacterium]
MKTIKFLTVLKFTFFITLAVFGIGLIVMLLWNWLVPLIFNGPILTYWQSIGILILSKILISGFNHHKYNHHNPSTYWRKKMEEKLARMTPEEREKYKSKFCGHPFHHHRFMEKTSSEEEKQE